MADGAADQIAKITMNLPDCFGHIPLGRNMQVDGKGKVHVMGVDHASMVNDKLMLKNILASHVQRKTNGVSSKPNLNGGTGYADDAIGDVPLIAITFGDVKELKTI